MKPMMMMMTEYLAMPWLPIGAMVYNFGVERVARKVSL
jgi:hypothetical protein